MKTFSVEKLPGEPIVISTAFPEWHAARNFEAFAQELVGVLDTASEDQLYYIANLNEWKPDLPQVIQAANQAARGSVALLRHPKIVKFLVVTRLKIVDMAARGLESEVFGKIPVASFTTLDDALAYARRPPVTVDAGR